MAALLRARQAMAASLLLLLLLVASCYSAQQCSIHDRPRVEVRELLCRAPPGESCVCCSPTPPWTRRRRSQKRIQAASVRRARAVWQDESPLTREDVKALR